MNTLLTRPGRRSGQAGYSLLEVLITILIASFGLLALAGMLLKGIQHSNSSFARSVAAQQAYDLADRMRANTPGLKNGSYDSIAFDAAENCVACTAVALCTPSGLAAYDACSWNKQNRALLPFGQGSVSKSGKVYLVTVRWDDTHSGGATADLSKFELKVDP